MNTRNFLTLQVFQCKSKSQCLQCCSKEFLRFLCERILNLLKGNLQSTKRRHVAKSQSEVRLLSLRGTTRKQRRDIVASKKACSSYKLLVLSSLTICLDMEQFVLVAASRYNRSLNTQSFKKMSFPNYQPLKIPLTKLIHLRRQYVSSSHIRKRFFQVV